MGLGENIKKLREAKGLTQTELGELIGKSLSRSQKYKKRTISPSLSGMAVSNYELGKRIPKEPVIESLADVLGVRVQELLGIDPPHVDKAIKDISQFSTDELLAEIFRRTDRILKREEDK